MRMVLLSAISTGSIIVWLICLWHWVGNAGSIFTAPPPARYAYWTGFMSAGVGVAADLLRTHPEFTMPLHWG